MRDMRSIQQWEHDAQASLERSRARRWSPHPVPHGAEWRLFLALCVLAFLGLVIAACLWAVS